MQFSLKEEKTNCWKKWVKQHLWKIKERRRVKTGTGGQQLDQGGVKEDGQKKPGGEMGVVRRRDSEVGE